MASTSFTDQVTVIPAAWLNDVNAVVWTIFNGLSATPSSGKTLRSNGTNIVASTFTIPDTYTTGDLIQASGTNTLAALAAVATGNALLSGGVGTASSWGKVGLTTHVSGTLPVTNGGTGLATFTAKGAIPAASAATTLVAQAVGTDGQALAADSSQNSGLVYVDNPSRPNLLVNPNWQIDQINEGALYTVNTTGVNGPDGWSGNANGTGVFKLRTLADPDNAALKCLEITCTTADAAIAAGDFYFIHHYVEGYDAAALMAGTASAQPITLQFKFKSNVLGVYSVAIRNNAQNRSYVGTFTVADANEHEYSITLTLDTAGTWLYTNGAGLQLSIGLAIGSTFQTAAGAWAAGNFLATAAQCNFMSANTNVAYLKRIQLIPGALVQAYKPADIQKELAKAQRFYEKTYSQGVAVGTITTAGQVSYAAATTAGEAAMGWHFRVSKHTGPTMVIVSPTTGASGSRRNLTSGADEAASFVTASTENAFQHNVGHTATNVYAYQATSNARLS